MNTETNSHTTPPGYWFGVIEHELRHRMRDELAAFDLRRGSWRVLSTIADGATSVAAVEAALPPRRDGKRHGARWRRGGEQPFGRGLGEHPHGHGHDEHPHHRHPHGHDEHPHSHGHGQHPHDHDEHPHPRGFRDHHPSRVEATIADFAARGWVTRSGDHHESVELTGTGREAYESALARIQGLRASMAAGIGETEYTTTIATLEAMARNLGWRETPPQEN